MKFCGLFVLLLMRAVWDQTQLSRFSWICYDVSTYEHYSDETTYENSLVYHGCTLQLSSLVHVMHSLTHNAREIFLLLVKHQLATSDISTYIGMNIHIAVYIRSCSLHCIQFVIFCFWSDVN